MDETPPLQLRDIHLPDAISWWPPAPGWWGLLLLIVLCFLSLQVYREIQIRREVRVAALKQLKDLTARFEKDQNQHKLVSSLSVLLRRICLSYFPREQVASLSGEAWLHFLDAKLGERGQSAETLDGNIDEKNQFRDGPGRMLIIAPYQPKAEIDGHNLLRLCGEWIKILPPRGRHS